VTCPKCRTENGPGAKFCVECGESFKGRCPKCGLATPANAKFCQECGTSFGEAAEAKKSVGDGQRAVYPRFWPQTRFYSSAVRRIR
jgi:uncharacterized membrane protein YvbJ